MADAIPPQPYQILPIPRNLFEEGEMDRIDSLSTAMSEAFQKTNDVLNKYNTYVRNVNFKNNLILTQVKAVRLKVYNLLRLINKLNRRIRELEGQGREGDMIGQEDNELPRLRQQKAYLMTLLDRAAGTLMQLRDGIDNIMQNPDLDLTADKTSQFVGVINQINALLQDILSKETPPDNIPPVGDNEIPLTQVELNELDAEAQPVEADVDNAPALPPNSINLIPPAPPAPPAPPLVGGGKRRRRKTRKLRRKSRGGKKSKSKSRKGIRGRSKRGGFKAVYPQLSHKKMSKSRTSKSSKSSRSSNRSSRMSSTNATSK